MTRITIETGIPIPPRNRHVKRPRGSKYPVAALRVKESFFVPGMKITSAGTVYRVAARLGRKVTCRATGGGIRFWRVK